MNNEKRRKIYDSEKRKQSYIKNKDKINGIKNESYEKNKVLINKRRK